MRHRQLKEVVFVNSNGEKKALHGCRPAEVYT